jgi:hypothetical protein
MWSRWVVPIVLICGVGVLASPVRARGDQLPGGLNLCLNSTMDGSAQASDFRSSPGVATEFRSSTNGCGGILDSILGGGGPWTRAAGTALETSRLMFGVDLDVKKFLEFARRLGIASQAADRPAAGAPSGESDGEFDVQTHRSFFLKASRKQFLIGFGIRW